MCEELNYELMEEETNFEPATDAAEESGSTGLSKLAIGLIAAGGTFVATKVVPKVYAWGKKKIADVKAKKALRRPEEGKTVEPTEAQIQEATGVAPAEDK